MGTNGEGGYVSMVFLIRGRPVGHGGVLVDYIISFCMWKRSKVSRWMFFFWNCNTLMTSCMFPRVCECSSRCMACLEVW